MAEQGSTNGGETASGQPQAMEPPGIHVVGQYIKDLSFENPGAPASLRSSDDPPKLGVNVNVNARPGGEETFEVELKVEGNATRGEETLFIVELTYAGLFHIQNVPREHIQPILLIECPRMLFPFARHIVADATRQGGFPPLMIDPMDFAALYRRKMAEVAARQQTGEQQA